MYLYITWFYPPSTSKLFDTWSTEMDWRYILCGYVLEKLNYIFVNTGQFERPVPSTPHMCGARFTGVTNSYVTRQLVKILSSVSIFNVFLLIKYCRSIINYISTDFVLFTWTVNIHVKYRLKQVSDSRSVTFKKITFSSYKEWVLKIVCATPSKITQNSQKT